MVSHYYKPRRTRIRLECVALALLAGFSSVAVGDELADAIAEADRLDPGWRLEEMVARRNASRPPDARNSVVQVQRVLDLLPGNWNEMKPGDERSLGPDEVPRGYRLNRAIDNLDFQQPLSRNLARGLRAELEEFSGAVAEARKLAGMPDGQTRFTLAENPLLILLPYEQNSRDVARLLRLDLEHRLAQGDRDAAMTSDLAIMNVGRSMGNAPFMISQAVRMAIDQIAIHALRRILDRGSPAEKMLARLQKAFAAEADEPRLLFGMRGERAIRFEVSSKLDAGKLHLSDLMPGQDSSQIPPISPAMLSRGLYRHNQARCLKLFTDLIEIVKLPEKRQLALLDRWQANLDASWAEYKKKSSLSERLWDAPFYMLLPDFTITVGAERRTVCRLRCAETALAILRYHGASRHWPETIEQLVPAYLKAVPVDPFTEGPIHFKREQDQLILYGTGKDKKDDGGRLNLDPPPGYDIGFALRVR